MPDTMGHFRRGRNLMILRTLSKAYGLAGLRIGFAIAPADVTKWLLTAKLPFNTNVVAQAGAIAALDDREFLRRTRNTIRRSSRFCVRVSPNYRLPWHLRRPTFCSSRPKKTRSGFSRKCRNAA